MTNSLVISTDPGSPAGQVGAGLHTPRARPRTDLLVHVLATIVAAARRAGGRVVLVDAVDNQARAFYEHHDFQQLPGRPHRLATKLSTAAQPLDLPWL